MTGPVLTLRVFVRPPPCMAEVCCFVFHALVYLLRNSNPHPNPHLTPTKNTRVAPSEKRTQTTVSGWDGLIINNLSSLTPEGDVFWYD